MLLGASGQNIGAANTQQRQQMKKQRLHRQEAEVSKRFFDDIQSPDETMFFIFLWMSLSFRKLLGIDLNKNMI